MNTALLILGSSGLLLLLLSGIFLIEDYRQGKLLVLARVRNIIDHAMHHIVTRMHTLQLKITQGVLLSAGYYLLHSILKQALRFARSFELKIERMLHHNKSRASALVQGSEKTHLESIADHKFEVALSDAQKRKLKAH